MGQGHRDMKRAKRLQKDKNKAEKGMKQTPNGVSAVDAEKRLRVTPPLADGAFLGLLVGRLPGFGVLAPL